ncbi:GlcG/HbpS family heme-binding protein [Streptomyces sp. NPDC003487]
MPAPDKSGPGPDPRFIAIADAGGRLIPFTRMDDAWLGSVVPAVTKAKTSVLFRMPRAALGEISQPGGPVHGIAYGNDGLISFGGGLPNADADGRTGRGVGVFGATADQDAHVAEATAEGTGPPASRGSTGDRTGRATCPDRSTVRRSRRPPVVWTEHFARHVTALGSWLSHQPQN